MIGNRVRFTQVGILLLERFLRSSTPSRQKWRVISLLQVSSRNEKGFTKAYHIDAVINAHNSRKSDFLAFAWGSNTGS